MNKRKRNLLVATGLAIAFVTYLNYDYPYTPNYVITEDDEAFASYSNGKVYIGDKEYIARIKPIVNYKDVLIELGYDDYDAKDPNAKIISSYRIDNKQYRYEILNILKVYSEMYPSDWNRSLESMRVEWTIHNALYSIGYEEHRTKDVDLDNSEEKLYNNVLLKRLIK